MQEPAQVFASLMVSDGPRPELAEAFAASGTSRGRWTGGLSRTSGSPRAANAARSTETASGACPSASTTQSWPRSAQPG